MTQTKQFLHSTFRKTTNGDGIVACVKDVNTNISSLEIVRNPKRTMYVTKPGLRESHTCKKEFAYKRELDAYMIHNHELNDELKDKLGYGRRQYVKVNELIDSPYSYGNDMPIETLMKQTYKNSCDKVCDSYSVGGLDIEVSVLGGNELIAITFVDDDMNSYTAVLKAFLKGANIQEAKELTKKSLLEFRNNLNPDAQYIFDQYTPTQEYFVSISEVEMVRWIFDKIHTTKCDFISIWNESYDIPKILDRLKFHGANPWNILCHPDVPKDLRVCRFIEDKTPPEMLTHWSHKWHHFSLSGYSQFYDSMCLYSRLRKVDGIESKYTLKYIADKILGTSKLNFGEDGHAVMQKSRFIEYIAYNIVDTIILPLFDKVTSDVSSLVLLMVENELPIFAKQTRQLRNSFYDYCRTKNAVPGSTSGNQNKEYDSFINNVGGGVLQPLLVKNVGTSKLKETDKETSICLMVSDLDVVLNNSLGTILAPCSSNAA